MAPELQKLRSPATARLLDQFANLWLLITVGAVLLSLLLSGSRAQAPAPLMRSMADLLVLSPFAK